MTFYTNKNFVWDANNRLTHVYSTTVPGHSARYYYSAMNTRVKKIVDSGGNGLLVESTVYIYCGQQVCEEQNENGVFKRDYVHGGQFIDEVVMTCDSPSGLGRFSLTDLRYSVYAVVDSSGVVVERYQYDPYGKRTVMNAGYGVMAKSVIGQEFGYTGRQHDSEDTGLMYFRARYYSVDLGRFVGRDPLGTALDVNWMNLLNELEAGSVYVDGMNLYVSYFVVNEFDWNGMDSVKFTPTTKEGVKLVKNIAKQTNYKPLPPWTLPWSKPNDEPTDKPKDETKTKTKECPKKDEDPCSKENIGKTTNDYKAAQDKKKPDNWGDMNQCEKWKWQKQKLSDELSGRMSV